MPFARIYSAQNQALKASVISVEMDVSRGLHSFSIVGLPNKAVEESKDRVSAAIKNSGFRSPKQANAKITVSLAPADLKKEGPSFDLPIALAYLLISSDDVSFTTDDKLFTGELSLDGRIRPVRGVYAIAHEAARVGIKEIYVAEEDAPEASTVEGIDVFGVATLSELIIHLCGPIKKKQANFHQGAQNEEGDGDIVSFDDISGMAHAKRAMTVAVAGRHPIALFGPPGTGKSMLARAALSISPDLSKEERSEVLPIHSASGKGTSGILTRPPFRSPHHTSSYASLIGSGSTGAPGEITLAHKGILFLDEFLEFDRRAIESMRQPLSDKKIHISRARKNEIFPADFMLITAFNPCPCGNRGSRKRRCSCSAHSVRQYEKKLSGALIDRICIWVEMEESDYEALSKRKPSKAETREALELVMRGRNAQESRSKVAHSKRDTREMISDEAANVLMRFAKSNNISARSHENIKRVARTIADMGGSETVEPHHVLEALQYRKREFNQR